MYSRVTIFFVNRTNVASEIIQNSQDNNITVSNFLKFKFCK